MTSGPQHLLRRLGMENRKPLLKSEQDQFLLASFTPR